MSRSNRRHAFTLVEILIVVVIMAILAATIIPQFADSTIDAKISTAKFNLNTIRGQLQIYKAQHGVFPTTTNLVTALTQKTNPDGTTTGSPTLGPYLQAFPTDPFYNSTSAADSTANPIAVTGTTGGYIFNSSTGEIRLNSTLVPSGQTAAISTY